jgi:hypothetical protein
MQATKILELQNDNLALKTENDRLLAAKKVLQNERKVWNEKYLNAKQEVTNLVGARSTETRKLEAAAATVRNLEKEAVAKGKELALVRKDLNKARTQLAKPQVDLKKRRTTHRMHPVVVPARMSSGPPGRN